MAIKLRLNVGLALAIAVSLALAGCLTPDGNPSPSPSATPVPTPEILRTSFAEVLIEDPGCADAEGYCFHEYMIFEDGKMLKKFVTKEKANSVQAEIRQAPREKAAELLDWTKTGWVEQDKTCKGCPQYHAIYFDPAQTRRIIAETGIASEFVKEFFGKAKALYTESQESERFYVQLYYKKRGGNLVDYHFFADGTVVHEQFDSEDNLLSAQVLRVDGAKVRSAAAGGMDSDANYWECLKAGYEYSYMDVVLEAGGATGVFTCGMGDFFSDKAYRRLRALVEA